MILRHSGTYILALLAAAGLSKPAAAQDAAPTVRRIATTVELAAQEYRLGVENGYPIGNDLKRVREFYDRGARYMSLAHNGNSQLADSNTGETQGYLYNNGLSPLGRHDGRSVASLERRKYGSDASFQGSGNCVAFGGARARRREP